MTETTSPLLRFKGCGNKKSFCTVLWRWLDHHMGPHPHKTQVPKSAGAQCYRLCICCYPGRWICCNMGWRLCWRWELCSPTSTQECAAGPGYVRRGHLLLSWKMDLLLHGEITLMGVIAPESKISLWVCSRSMLQMVRSLQSWQMDLLLLGAIRSTVGSTLRYHRPARQTHPCGCFWRLSTAGSYILGCVMMRDNTFAKNDSCWLRALIFLDHGYFSDHETWKSQTCGFYVCSGTSETSLGHPLTQTLGHMVWSSPNNLTSFVSFRVRGLDALEDRHVVQSSAFAYPKIGY